MMIIDLNQVVLSNIFMSNAMHASIEEGMIRHMVLNSIRRYVKKFGQQYGKNIVIACDSRHYWRKDVYPYYKANRKKTRDESTLDWKALFEILSKIREELKEVFPYRVIDINGAEADDVIATLCKEFGWAMGNRILIISGDKDFIQLHKYPAVDQYAPIQDKMIRHNDPEGYLKEHILTGDVGDGIPNVLSPDNCLVLGTRQTIMTAKRKAALATEDYSIGPISEAEIVRNVNRNRILIDMEHVPTELGEKILESYHAQEDKKGKDLLTYFINNKLRNLTEAIGDFV